MRMLAVYRPKTMKAPELLYHSVLYRNTFGYIMLSYNCMLCCLATYHTTTWLYYIIPPFVMLHRGTLSYVTARACRYTRVCNVYTLDAGVFPVSVKNHSSKERHLGQTGLQSSRSGAGEQPLLLDRRAKALANQESSCHRNRSVSNRPPL